MLFSHSFLSSQFSFLVSLSLTHSILQMKFRLEAPAISPLNLSHYNPRHSNEKRTSQGLFIIGYNISKFIQILITSDKFQIKCVIFEDNLAKKRKDTQIFSLYCKLYLFYIFFCCCCLVIPEVRSMAFGISYFSVWNKKMKKNIE